MHFASESTVTSFLVAHKMVVRMTSIGRSDDDEEAARRVAAYRSAIASDAFFESDDKEAAVRRINGWPNFTAAIYKYKVPANAAVIDSVSPFGLNDSDRENIEAWDKYAREQAGVQ